MNLYNGIEVIKDFFRMPVIGAQPGPDAEMDARMLANMCVEAKKMSALNGKSYWYYFISDIANKDIVRFLLKRNGVVPTFRMSRYRAYHGRRHAAFRLRLSYFDANPAVEKFVDSISYKWPAEHVPDLQQRIEALRASLGQKQK